MTAGRGPGGRAGRHPAPTHPERGDHRAAFVAGFVTLFCEVEATLRPRRLLAPMVTPMLLARLAGLAVLPGPPARVVRVTGDAVAPAAYEATAVVRRGPRCTALGLRLVRTDAGWRVDEIVRPGMPPLPTVDPPCADDPVDAEEEPCRLASPEIGRVG